MSDSRAVRRPLPNERPSFTHKFKIIDSENVAHRGYVHVGLYADGTPGELFVKMDKEGSLLSGLIDGLAIITSMALQHGVPLKTITSKLTNMSFAPSGRTENEKIPRTRSILDYLGRWLELKFEPPEAPTP